LQKGYGKNDYHKHIRENRTIVTQLGKTTFTVTRVKDKSTSRTFCPLYNLIEFDEKRLYQPDIGAIAVDYALSMSYRESRQRLQRMTESPSQSTIWRRVQELGMEGEKESFEYDSFVSADGTKLHAQRCEGKFEVKDVAGRSVIVGVNEGYKEMRERYEIRAAVVGDADKDLNCFEERQIDLINWPGCTKHLIMNYRASREWFEIAIRLLTKPVERFEPFDKELLTLSFTTWLENIDKKVLVFMDLETSEIITKPYMTRFNDPQYVKYLLAKYNEAWRIASEIYDVGVLLILTLPPIFSLKIEQYLLSFLLHRLRNWLKRRYGFTPPSIVTNEPQKSLNFHKNVVFFRISRIMDKKELTIWMDKIVITYLKRAGHHTQKTVNNRLKPEEVKALNKYGKKLLKRYLRYKKKHKRYQGPVNWLTKIYKDENGKWVFKNPPPDLQGNKKEGTLFDGANASVPDYIKKYIIKNLRSALEGAEKEKDQL